MAATVAQRPQARLYGLYALAGLAFLLLAGQLWSVQIANHSQYQRRAEVNRVRLVSEKALRDVVYDRAGRQVTRNVAGWTLAIRPADMTSWTTQPSTFFPSATTRHTMSRSVTTPTGRSLRSMTGISPQSFCTMSLAT